MQSNHLNDITGIVFSKNRALQLDATLRSFLLNCRDSYLVSLNVLYTASSELFLNQYQKLKHEYSNNPYINFFQQRNFKRDVFNIINIPHSKWDHFSLNFRTANEKNINKNPVDKFVLFLVDDNIFVRNFHLSKVVSALNRDKSSLGFSLQLGTNINYCYPLNIPVRFPNYISIHDEVIKFHWPDAGDGLNYPLEISSSAYRLSEMVKLLMSLKFTNPNLMEGRMATRAGNYRESHPYILCFKQSVTFCNPVNKVQNIYDNKAGVKPEYSVDHLARLFDEGYRIDVKPYQNIIPNACHQEVELVLSKDTYDKD